MNWDFFLVWKQTGYFYQYKLIFFPSFWARAKYFDWPCLTIFPFYSLKRYTLPTFGLGGFTIPTAVNLKKWKPGKFHLCSFWNNIFNYPNWDFGFCQLDISNWDFLPVQTRKNSNWIFQTGDFQKLLKSQCR